MNAQEPLLYHYTTQSGLIGILASKVLWASHIHYLNDQKEFWHAFDVARRELRDRAARSSVEREKERLETLDEVLSELLHTGVCVSSFSEDGDSLSQWRAYGGGGSGFAIGFSRSSLEELASRESFALGACIYESNAQKAQVCELIDSTMATDFNTVPVIVSPESPREITVLARGGDFLRNISSLAPLLKHHSFYEEREWRLISTSGVNVSKLLHRPSSSMLIPYFPFSLSIDGRMACVKEVIVGPTPHPKLSERSLSTFLRANGFENSAPETRISQIPYRNW